MAVGWYIGDYNGVYTQIMSVAMDPDSENVDEMILTQMELIKEPQRRFNIHFQLGVACALTTVLINCLSVTYLIGTGRWVKEVCDAYGLDLNYDIESTKLKRKTFPWSIAGVASILMIVAFGAAADPGTLRETTAQWVKPHMIVSIVGTILIVWAILAQSRNLRRNANIINQVVAEVQRERQARGLPVEGV